MSTSTYNSTLKIIVPYKWQAAALKVIDGESLTPFFQALEGLIVEHISGVLEYTTRYNLQSGEQGPYVFQMDFKGSYGGFAYLCYIPGFIQAINTINPYSANYKMVLSDKHYINIGHDHRMFPHDLPPMEHAVGKPAAVCPSAPARVVSEKVDRAILLEPMPRMPTVVSPIPSGVRSPAVVQESDGPVPSQGTDIASLQSSMDSLQLDTIKSRSKARYLSLLSELAGLQQETYLLEEHRKDMLKQINENKKRMHVFEFAMDEIIDLMGGPEFIRE
jgi:hypothetical protein